MSKRSFPFPPYPNGWFQLAYSDELPPDQIVSLEYFGRDLIMFRGEDGTPQVLDAHCPHLGAHLGKGGKLAGNCVTCPFHAWRFNGRGECVEIPYGKKIPPKAKLGTWT